MSPLRCLPALRALSPTEIEAAIAAVRHTLPGGGPQDLCFIECFLLEPPPDHVMAWDNGCTPADVDPHSGLTWTQHTRRARLITWNKQSNATQLWVVELPSDPQPGLERRARAAGLATVLRSETVPDVQPATDAYEYETVEQVTKSDPGVQAALARRGVHDMGAVMADPWCVGYYSAADAPARRLNKPLLFVRTGGETDNGYARPVEGLEILVDQQEMRVVGIEDSSGPPCPLPPPDPLRNYLGPPAPGALPLKPLVIDQPQGPSFVVDGNAVSWHNWRLRVGFTPREGLVLHSLAIHDQDRGSFRQVAHRLSFVEMVVPYGDPHAPHFAKNAFDAGEDGLGKNAHSLELGCDCLGAIHYFDAHLSTFQGGAETIRNAVCMHEEDVGLLWKHVDWRTGATGSRRSRRLVLSFLCTIANYEYGFFFYLYMDGTIESQVKLTGILSTGALPPGATRPHGTMVAPQLYAPYHQHFFAARLHMAVDANAAAAAAGPRTANTVVEREVHPCPVAPHDGGSNPHCNAFAVREAVLGSEAEAQRQCRPEADRHWEVRSGAGASDGGASDGVVRGRMGRPTAYRLVPGKNQPVLAHPSAAFLRRAQFLSSHLWVTQYHPEERYPGGEFPNQNPRAGDGLPRYAAQDRALVGQSLVLWYMFGVTHIPRPEDWPVMPVETCGFALQPCGFFDRNPAINTPPEAPGGRAALPQEGATSACPTSPARRASPPSSSASGQGSGGGGCCREGGGAAEPPRPAEPSVLQRLSSAVLGHIRPRL